MAKIPRESQEKFNQSKAGWTHFGNDDGDGDDIDDNEDDLADDDVDDDNVDFVTSPDGQVMTWPWPAKHWQ